MTSSWCRLVHWWQQWYMYTICIGLKKKLKIDFSCCILSLAASCEKCPWNFADELKYLLKLASKVLPFDSAAKLSLTLKRNQQSKKYAVEFNKRYPFHNPRSYLILTFGPSILINTKGKDVMGCLDVENITKNRLCRFCMKRFQKDLVASSWCNVKLCICI